MKSEIIELCDKKLIGIINEIPVGKGHEECPKCWDRFVARVLRPIYMEGQQPDAFQLAAVQNHVGSYALCCCHLPKGSCAHCSEKFLKSCGLAAFSYIIGGIYDGDDIPLGMNLISLHSGRWIKFHFEGGMKAFQQQMQQIYEEWFPALPEIRLAANQCLEWYDGMDIQSPDYKCGVMFPIE